MTRSVLADDDIILLVNPLVNNITKYCLRYVITILNMIGKRESERVRETEKDRAEREKERAKREGEKERE